MARTPRSQLPDGAFHVISHAVAREPLFCDNLDCKMYLGLLQQTVEAYRWKVLTFVLMGNHVHLLVIAATADLSKGLWWLHWKYATYVHQRHQRWRGHIFEARPKTPPITNERYLLAVLRYIANNPVKHGFCRNPEEHAWSGHRAILGLSAPLPLLAVGDVLGLFANDPQVGRIRYANFVAGADPAEHREVRRWAEGPLSERPPLSDLLKEGDAAAIRSAHLDWEYSLRAIGEALEISPATVLNRIKRSG